MKSLFLTLFSSVFAILSYCQSFVGDWEGALKSGQRSIDIVFHITIDGNNSYLAKLDVPVQKAFNVPASEVFVEGDSIVIIIKAVSLRFVGMLRDNKNMNGNWKQAGMTIQVPMKRTGNGTNEKTFKRPQTPQPPFPYKSEEVEFDNKDKSIHFGATFTIPSSGGRLNEAGKTIYPVVILITGSGKQDRDETMFEHKPFAIIADYFTKKGIAVLRMDDREMGKSTGDFMNSTTFDFVKDIEAGIDYLKGRQEVDIQNIGLLGHSEGGLIAPILASKRDDIKFMVLMAAPGLKFTELMEQQNVNVLVSQGISQKIIEDMKPMLRDLVNTIITAPDTSIARINGIKIFNTWQENQSRTVVKNTTGVTDEASMNNYIKKRVFNLNVPWYATIMKIDPSIYLTALKCSVLAINGEKDIQVDAKANLAAIGKYLKQSASMDFEVKSFKGLNHLFQHCKKCTFEEYLDIEETIAPEVLEFIGNWISERVKQ